MSRHTATRHIITHIHGVLRPGEEFDWTGPPPAGSVPVEPEEPIESPEPVKVVHKKKKHRPTKKAKGHHGKV